MMTGSLATSSVLAAAASFGSLVGGIGGGWIVAAGLMAWRRTAGIAASATMGLAVSLYLGRQHHPSHAPSACNVDEVFNCDVVNQSVYAELGGIPIAFLGAGFYAGCLVLMGLAARSSESYSRAGHLVTLGGLLSVVYSGFLGYQSSLMNTWCLFCISLYGVNALILGGGLWMVKESGVSLGGGMKEALAGRTDRSFSTMATAGAVALVLSMLWYRGLGDGQPAPSAGDAGPADVSSLVEAISEGAALDGTEAVYGSPSAPYTVLEWADFECPHCGIVAPELKQLVDENPDIKVVFRSYPLDDKCNANITRKFHEHSCRAAFAAECARKQGKFWDLTALMFKNQAYLDPAGIQTRAGQKGLDTAALTACMADPSTELAIQADIEAGEKAGVSGTPALFLQGAHGDGTWVKLRASPAQIGTIVAAHKAAGAPLPIGG